MQEEEKKTSKRGGARPGAGRKRSRVKSYAFHAPQEVYDILEAVEGSKSEFICQCILKAAQLPWAALFVKKRWSRLNNWPKTNVFQKKSRTFEAN